MSDAEAALREGLEALSGQYRRQLPEKIREIEETWKRLDGDDWDLETLASLRQLVHSLAGSGATFGFRGVSDSAREIENILRPVLEGDSGPTAGKRSRILEHLEDLKRAASAPDEEGPDEAPAEAAPAAAPGPGPEGSKDLLLVNPSQHTLVALAPQFEHFGYSIRAVNASGELEAAFAGTPPAAAIFESGSEAGAGAKGEDPALLSSLTGRGVPVVFLSDRDDLESRLDAVRAGCRAYFVTPPDLGTLVDSLDNLTARPDESDPYRVLVVDDHPQLAGHYALVLQRAGMVARALSDPLRIMEELTDLEPELLIIDLYMPGCTGLELASVLRQQDAYAGIPIVFLSTESRIEKQQKAMGLGGDDFLTKPIEDDHLVGAVSSRVQRARVLRSFMVRDSLTGLLNHTSLTERLAIEVERAKRQDTELSFAMIDIDHFKSVNDVHGHPVGDHVIVALSRVLRQRLRRTDIVGRYGGEEFAAILPDTEGDAAREVLDEIRRGFEEIRHRSHQEEFSVTFSCGIATFPGTADPEALTERADKALYAAKSGGRNNVVLARD